MADPAAGMNLGHAVALLAAAVVAVPLFRKFGLGSVLGYLAAGVVIGPFALGLIGDPEAILHVAEFGVVMFLFINGLEMRPAKLWKLRKEIFGLGAAQVLACGLLLTGTAIAFGVAPAVAFVGAMGFVLSSTAVIMQTMDERNEINTPHGQRAVSILLLEDLAIVPLLAIVAVLGTALGTAQEGPPLWQTASLAIAAVIGVFFLVRFRDYAFAGVLLWAFYGVYVARPDAATVVTGVAVAAAVVVIGALLSLRSRHPLL